MRRQALATLLFAAAASNFRAVKSVRAVCTVVKTSLASWQENQIERRLEIAK
jgi:hypothetical protein